MLRLEKRDVLNMYCYCCKRKNVVVNRIGFWHSRLEHKLVLCNKCALMLAEELAEYAQTNRGSVKDLEPPKAF